MTGAGAVLSLQVGNKIVPVQACDSISYTENVPLGKVKGIGTFEASEIVALDWNGSGSLSFYHLPYKDSPARLNLDARDVQDIEQWANRLLTRIKTDGAIISVLQRGFKPDGSFGLFEFCILKYVFVSNMSTEISEGGISKIRYDFEYTNPIIYPK